MAEITAGQPPLATCAECGAPVPAPAAGTSTGIALRATLPQPVAAALLRTGTLTARERAVFELLGFGYDNRSIARALQISERTVKRYITAILGKLHLESRLQIGLTAIIISSSSAAAGYWPEGRMELP